ncbi:MAG: ABC transporter ATP-binding protein [Rhizobiaceae bacterium]|nr:ABC transporter ATP-binding protein [Rhizobiaceae bacterium]
MLSISQLSKHFDDAQGVSHTALEAIDVVVGDHDFVSLVGTSGCGKSTLLRIVSGLEAPTSGTVDLGGNRVLEPTPDVAMVFQEPRLMPWLTVTENVRLAVIGLAKAEQDARIEDALSQVGLSDFATALPRQLSGGMAQRVAIARALVRKPKVLLLDEPFSALDSFTRAKLQDHILDIYARSRFTVILVTHDVEEAVTLSDRVLVMRGHPGRIERDVAIDLPRPRRRTAAEVQAIKEEIIAALKLA